MARPTRYEKALEEDRRAKISITKQLNQLADIQENLESNWQNLDNAKVGALRLRSDIALKLLAKRMPDLKAIDVDLDVDGEIGIREIVKAYVGGSE